MRIIEILKRPFVYAIIFSVVLLMLNAAVLLKTFVVSSTEDFVEAKAESPGISAKEASQSASANATSYTDENISITIDTLREYDTDIYIADITLSSPKYLQTALANNAFGTNITQTTSSMAADHDAILAINGDYYGANRSGYVIKNSELYRSSIRGDSEYDDLVIYEDGSFGVINETEASAESLIDNGVANLFAFGPALLQNSEICVSENSEVGKAMSGNPRTVIGIVDELHYIIMVSDGRTDESEGLSLYEAAQVMAEYGCESAYNLDGGGSSTMYFNGEIINNPTTNGKNISEREVSDIVYIGY